MIVSSEAELVDSLLLPDETHRSRFVRCRESEKKISALPFSATLSGDSWSISIYVDEQQLAVVFEMDVFALPLLGTPRSRTRMNPTDSVSENITQLLFVEDARALQA